MREAVLAWCSNRGDAAHGAAHGDDVARARFGDAVPSDDAVRAAYGDAAEDRMLAGNPGKSNLVPPGGDEQDSMHVDGRSAADSRHRAVRDEQWETRMDVKAVSRRQRRSRHDVGLVVRDGESTFVHGNESAQLSCFAQHVRSPSSRDHARLGRSGIGYAHRPSSTGDVW